MTNKSTIQIAVVCMSVGLSAVLLLTFGGALTVSADCPGEPPCDNGDVNADGRLDISDAVHLLNHLFLGGPAPVPIECPPVPCLPPATGQTLCYDAVGNVIDCDNDDCPASRCGTCPHRQIPIR